MSDEKKKEVDTEEEAKKETPEEENPEEENPEEETPEEEPEPEEANAPEDEDEDEEGEEDDEDEDEPEAAEPVDEDEEEAHVLPVKLYFQVFGALLVLTVLTVLVSLANLGKYGLGSLAIGTALVVAIAKSGLVVGYFMHLKYDMKFYSLVFFSAVLFVGLFIGLVMVDLTTRKTYFAKEEGTFTKKIENREKKAADKLIKEAMQRPMGAPATMRPAPRPSAGMK